MHFLLPLLVSQAKPATFVLLALASYLSWLLYYNYKCRAILFLGASTNKGVQNKQQRLKSLNLSGTDMSKVITLAPLPPFTNIGITHGSMFQLDPKLLAAGIVKLKEITLTYTCLTL